MLKYRNLNAVETSGGGSKRAYTNKSTNTTLLITSPAFNIFVSIMSKQYFKYQK